MGLTSEYTCIGLHCRSCTVAQSLQRWVNQPIPSQCWNLTVAIHPKGTGSAANPYFWRCCFWQPLSNQKAGIMKWTYPWRKRMVSPLHTILSNQECICLSCKYYSSLSLAYSREDMLPGNHFLLGSWHSSASHCTQACCRQSCLSLSDFQAGHTSCRYPDLVLPEASPLPHI